MTFTSEKQRLEIEAKLLLRELEFGDQPDRVYYVAAYDDDLADRIRRQIIGKGAEAVVIPLPTDHIEVAYTYANTRVFERARVFFVHRVDWLTPLRVEFEVSVCEKLGFAGGHRSVYERRPTGHWTRTDIQTTWIT